MIWYTETQYSKVEPLDMTSAESHFVTKRRPVSTLPIIHNIGREEVQAADESRR